MNSRTIIDSEMTAKEFLDKNPIPFRIRGGIERHRHEVIRDIMVAFNYAPGPPYRNLTTFFDREARAREVCLAVLGRDVPGDAMLTVLQELGKPKPMKELGNILRKLYSGRFQILGPDALIWFNPES